MTKCDEREEQLMKIRYSPAKEKKIEISHVVLPMQISNYLHFFCAMAQLLIFRLFFYLFGGMAHMHSSHAYNEMSHF